MSTSSIKREIKHLHVVVVQWRQRMCKKAWFCSLNLLFFHFLIGHFRVPPGFCFKTRIGAQPLIWKSFFILIQIKLIFTRKVVHLAPFWKWGFLELWSGLLPSPSSLLKLPTNTKATTAKTSLKTLKRIRAVSNFTAIILPRSICQNVANFSVVEFETTLSNSAKSLLFTFFTKGWNYELSRRSRAVTAKKCTKKRKARTEKYFFLPFSLLSPSPLLNLPSLSKTLLKPRRISSWRGVRL